MMFLGLFIGLFIDDFAANSGIFVMVGEQRFYDHGGIKSISSLITARSFLHAPGTVGSKIIQQRRMLHINAHRQF